MDPKAESGLAKRLYKASPAPREAAIGSLMDRRGGAASCYLIFGRPR
jgi:hypothetical protein